MFMLGVLCALLTVALLTTMHGRSWAKGPARVTPREALREAAPAMGHREAPPEMRERIDGEQGAEARARMRARVQTQTWWRAGAVALVQQAGPAAANLKKLLKLTRRITNRIKRMFAGDTTGMSVVSTGPLGGRLPG